MEEKFKVDTPVKNYAIRATGEEVKVPSLMNGLSVKSVVE